MSKDQIFQLRINEAQKNWLDKKKKETGVSINSTIRLLIQAQIEKEKVREG